MKIYRKAVLFFALIAASAFALRIIFFSNVVPLGQDETSPSGPLMAAFVVRAIENMGWAGLIITLLLGLVWLVSRRRRIARD